MATRCSSFDLHARTGQARAGTLHLPHGDVPTPAFMPVGTRATVRGLDPADLEAAGANIVLSNTYHLWVRPGHEVIAELGGLHRFMGWSGPILTDSGGYQVFSLRDHTKVTEEGVRFRSPEDGQYRMLTPEVAVEVQEVLGVDVAMAFDECLEHPATHERAAQSLARTQRWLLRCLAARRHADRTALFGILQGGLYEDLRAEHAQALGELDLDGYAIGGLSVGEDRDQLVAFAAFSAARLPQDRVRYLMGVGHPIDLAEAILAGVDLFDCVLPTRAGRHGTAYTSEGRRNLKNGRYRADPAPLDPTCPCSTCRRFSRGYLGHLVRADEILGKRLLTHHNLAYYLRLLARFREAILAGDAARCHALREEAAVASTAAGD
ncbi:MAG: tRNA guanosine(34) transglycosylase Tgt [Myxococcota bacterium]